MKLKAMYGKIACPLLFACFCFSSLILPLQAQESGSAPQTHTSDLAVAVKQYTFTLNPGASYSFPLPNVKYPIRIEVALTNVPTGGNHVNPTPLMWALVSVDGAYASWIGTNNEATTNAGDTDLPIACSENWISSISNGSAVIAFLGACEAPSLSVTQSSTTTVAGTYIVRVYY